MPFLLTLVSFAFTQGTSTDINLSLPVAENSVKTILSYNIRNNLQAQITAVQKHANSKIIGEFQVGGAYIQNNSNFGTLAIKISPFNSKIPSPSTLEANIFAIRQSYRNTNETIPPENDKLLSKIESELSVYNSHSKWLRPSFGLVFPFTVVRYDTTVNTNYQGDSATSSYRYIDQNYAFNLYKVGIVLGYDIGDFCTFSIGAVNFDDPHFFVGVGLDVSTPIYWMLAPFRDNISRLTKINEAYVTPYLGGTIN